jgi:ankyrin repeat protein
VIENARFEKENEKQHPGAARGDANGHDLYAYAFNRVLPPGTPLADGRQLFIQQVETGSVDAVLLCMKAGLDINMRTPAGDTALHVATKVRSAEVAAVLLLFGADAAAEDGEGTTPLYYACMDGSTTLIAMLLRAGARLDVQTLAGEWPIHAAIRSRALSVFKLVQRKTRKFIEKSQNIAHYDVLGIDTATGNSQALLSVKVGAAAITDYLASEGAPLDRRNVMGETALIVAIKTRQKETAARLQTGGASWEYHDDEGAELSALFVEHGMLPQLKRHFWHGANAHVLDARRENLLHKAAAADRADIVGYLLDVGVSTATRNDVGARPADRAVREAIR